MTDGVKVIVSDKPEGEILDKKPEPNVVKILGIDVDGTAAGTSSDGKSKIFQPDLQQYFFEHHAKWDEVVFITARLIRTSARDIYREFQGEIPRNISALSDAFSGINDSIEAALDKLTPEKATAYYPTFLSPFDDEAGVRFVDDVLMPFEDWFRGLLTLEFDERTKTHSTAFSHFIQIINRLNVKPYRDNKLYTDYLHQLLGRFVVDQKEKPLADRLRELIAELPPHISDFLFDKPLIDDKPLHLEWQRDIERFYLKTEFTVNPEHGDYASRYYNDHYPHFKAYGKTRSLVYHAKRVSDEPFEKCFLGLVDDSESFIRHSLKGALHCRDHFNIGLSLSSIYWERGFSMVDYKEDFDKFHTYIEKIQSKKVESPRSVTTILSLQQSAETGSLPTLSL